MAGNMGGAGGASKGNDGPVFRVEGAKGGKPASIVLMGFGLDVTSAKVRFDASERARQVAPVGPITFQVPR